MRAPAAKTRSRTLDLFATAEASLAAAEPASASAAAPASSPGLGASPPAPQAARRTRPRQLWYAVVFPQLADGVVMAGAADLTAGAFHRQAGSSRREGLSRSAEASPDAKVSRHPEISRNSETLRRAHASALLHKLCLQAQRFTSLVSIEPPNALLLEVKRSLKLFGTAAALHARIDAGWSQLDLGSASATAPSTLGALWLARGAALRPGHRHGKSTASRPAANIFPAPIVVTDPGALAGCLAKLPSVCTGWDEERLRTLSSMGVTRIGELLRLPRGGLAKRLGPACVRDLDLAMAREPAARRSFVFRERFRQRQDFETEIEHVAHLEKAAEPLIIRCSQFLRDRQAGIQRLYLKLAHRSAPATRVMLGFSSVTSERRRLMDVLTQRLSRLELPAPVRSLELVSAALRPLSAESLDALVGSRQGGRDTAPQLVERLRARLGDDAVYGVITIAEHRPEAAWRRIHEIESGAASRPPARDELPAAGRAGLPRPVWLLAEPRPIPPDFVLEEGPERIESGWWDGRGVARDYYVARQERRSRGVRLWVFQERRSKDWFLHGVFA